MDKIVLNNRTNIDVPANLSIPQEQWEEDLRFLSVGCFGTGQHDISLRLACRLGRRNRGQF
jgi:hypothetical protein